MSSPLATVAQEDDPMDGVEGSGDEEGEGDVIMPGVSDDSSEEEEEDEEEAQRIREGFIVDEDEDEDEGEDDEESRRKHRRKRRKRHHRRREEEEVLEDDDLELLEENTGENFKKRKSRLTRLRRGSESPPAASSSRRAQAIESSDDDLDDGAQRIQDIQDIWDDEKGRGEFDEEDMDDFIESDEGEGDDASREARRQERKRQEAQRRAQVRSHPQLAGIDANAWDEIHDVFGTGHEYDWALEADNQEEEEDVLKATKFADVFEPSEIRMRMLTEDDDIIRAQDIPERMQLATSSFSTQSSLSLHSPLKPEDVNGAAMWIIPRISYKKTRDFFAPDGVHLKLQAPLVEAVSFVVKQLFIEEYEVPYIWTHKRDHINNFNPKEIRARFELLDQRELWRIYTLGQKYRSLAARRTALQASYERLKVKDQYYEEDILGIIENVEVISDATEWLNMKYKDQKKNTEDDFHFHDDEEEVEVVKKHKMPSRVSAYEVAKKSVIAKLAEGFGIHPEKIVANFRQGSSLNFTENQDLNPLVYAEQFADPDSTKALAPEELLARARMILSTELGKDPVLREAVRQIFKDEAMITVEPTPKGAQKIDENHPYYNFKYLFQKPAKHMLDSAQFLHILAAEAEHLVTLHIFIPPGVKDTLENRLTDAFTSDAFTPSAQSWNDERRLVVREVIDQHLIPAAVKWTREFLREEVEDHLAANCGLQLRARIDVAPHMTPDNEISSVLAVSWGKGDPHKDPICMVFVDHEGRMRETTTVDNLVDVDQRDSFLDFVKRRKPDVIVIGGFSMATTKLSQRVKEAVGWNPTGANEVDAENSLGIPVMYVHDEVARLYQNSARSMNEFPGLSVIARYCVGLARYTQNPLNEFAALGSDITAITFVDEDQHLVPKEKLLSAFEHALVDVTNKVGVDINRAVTDKYYAHLLPFICGLGPRKAQMLIQKIGAVGGSLVNRQQFIKSGILTTKIFLNAAGFLRIPQEEPEMAKHAKSQRRGDDDLSPDPLDDTRIHPEDYDLARKMATDALELDEEDTHDYHPSYVVTQIMSDPDNDKKLSELNLDDFAISLNEASGDMKRHTLNVILEEVLRPFKEQRPKVQSLGAWDVLTALSGETNKTLKLGLIVSAQVQRVTSKIVHVRLDSGIEGQILPEFFAENSNGGSGLTKGQSIQGAILDVALDLDHDRFEFQLSNRAHDIAAGDQQYRRMLHDDYWNHTDETKEQDMKERKKRAEVDRTRRVIKHPNFHNFNTAQAEAYLDKQQRGDVVIRPSSKGFNHLAVTWKVDEKLYQHIDVTEINADPTGQGVGGQLVVDHTHTYADLDELIVNHVQAMARKVEDLKAHERFKGASDDELPIWLKQQLAANPGKSMYGFMLNRKKPGHFILGFLANKSSTVQTWPIRVTPEAYYLFDAAAVGVPELCDAFKVRHLHETNLAASGKTPFGAGSRTPARPGQATPGHASVRHPARTPNPYGGATPSSRYPPSAPPSNYAPTPGASNYAPTPGAMSNYGYQTPHGMTPGNGMTPGMPVGMNPARAALIAEQNRAGGSWPGWQ
ncbi:transcription elongation factor SPT6 [Mycena floridula]|nr:transcription elongation factor SPT6 [Mycena floridula]